MCRHFKETELKHQSLKPTENTTSETRGLYHRATPSSFTRRSAVLESQAERREHCLLLQKGAEQIPDAATYHACTWSIAKREGKRQH